MNNTWTTGNNIRAYFIHQPQLWLKKIILKTNLMPTTKMPLMVVAVQPLSRNWFRNVFARGKVGRGLDEVVSLERRLRFPPTRTPRFLCVLRMRVFHVMRLGEGTSRSFVVTSFFFCCKESQEGEI